MKLFDGVSEAALFDFFPFDPPFTGGVRGAVSDGNGAGRTDLILGPGRACMMMAEAWEELQ